MHGQIAQKGMGETTLLPSVPLIGSYLSFLHFTPVFLALVAIPIAIAFLIYICTHLKFDFKVPAYSLREQLRTFHFNTEWKHTFYDTDLNLNIPYAKHAISINENRKDFARVKWGVPTGVLLVTSSKILPLNRYGSLEITPT